MPSEAAKDPRRFGEQTRGNAARLPTACRSRSVIPWVTCNEDLAEVPRRGLARESSLVSVERQARLLRG
jgi:hypothetical protein